jgi:hypothetical protein
VGALVAVKRDVLNITLVTDNNGATSPAVAQLKAAFSEAISSFKVVSATLSFDDAVMVAPTPVEKEITIDGSGNPISIYDRAVQLLEERWTNKQYDEGWHAALRELLGVKDTRPVVDSPQA